MTRWAMGVEYDGTHFCGWQQQPQLRTVQGELERALSLVADATITAVCGGRTDAGVHAHGQVAHFDTDVRRSMRAWVLGTNAHLPRQASVSWVRPVPQFFHARYSALRRHYRYSILNRAARSAMHEGRTTWIHAPLDTERMQAGAVHLLGEHDFSAFRAAECQSNSPIRRVDRLQIERSGELVHIDIAANAFLHHMVRNMMGALIAVGQGKYPPDWLAEVLRARSRAMAAPTFPPDGLYFLGPSYESHWGLPERTDPYDGLP